jgi:hypothetical protein
LIIHFTFLTVVGESFVFGGKFLNYSVLTSFLLVSLVLNNAIIVERAANKPKNPWQVARVIGYDENTGAHR